MRNLVILGSGRCGASSVAGTLAQAGFFLGEGLRLPRSGSSKGLFEARAVVELNEELLAPQLDPNSGLGPGQSWLGAPLHPLKSPSGDQVQRIARLTQRGPFAIKDPRLAFTWPVWREALESLGMEQPGRVCLFRDPRATAEALVQACASVKDLQGLPFDLADAERLWVRVYQELLAQVGDGALFLHAGQLLDPVRLQRLAQYSEASLCGDFTDEAFQRTGRWGESSAEARELYLELCDRAEFSPSVSGSADSESSEIRPRIGVVVLLEAGQAALAREALVRIEEQQGVDTEVVFVYRGQGEPPLVLGARVLSKADASRSGAFALGIEATGCELVALGDLEATWLPGHLLRSARTLGVNPQLDWVLCSHQLSDAEGRFVERIAPPQLDQPAGPFWYAGVVARRASFEGHDQASYLPGELARFRALDADGRVERIAEVGFHVSMEAFQAKRAVAERDAALLELEAAAPSSERPDLSVVVESSGDAFALAQVVRSLCRQLVAPGSLEILLVVSVGDDAGWKFARELDIHLPLTRLQLLGCGAERLRQALRVARADRVWWLGRDLIPEPGGAAAHLAASAADGSKVVAGPLFASKQGGGLALEKFLASSTGLRRSDSAGEGLFLGAEAFAEGNVSFDRALAVSMCGLDERLEIETAAEDLGLRLAAAGLRTVEAPEAGARFARRIDFDDYRRRELSRAESRARLCLSWPELIRSEKLEGVGRAMLVGKIAEHGAALVGFEAACRELSGVQVDALEDLGLEFREVAREAVERLGPLLRALRPVWRAQGLMSGLKQCGLESFDEILEGEDPGSQPKLDRVLAWPRFGDPLALGQLLEACAPLVDTNARLVLRLDPELDPTLDQVVPELTAEFEARFGADANLDVEFVDQPFDSGMDGLGDWWKQRRRVSALLIAGGRTELTGIALRTGWRTLTEASDVEDWVTRGNSQDGRSTERISEPGEQRPKTEISVVIPTHDRWRELSRLLEALSRQTAPAGCFEVLIVDDGSEQPAGADLTEADWPFSLRILCQESAGPGAARNHGAREARSPVVLFLNDDAVPSEGLIQAHLEVQRSLSGAGSRNAGGPEFLPAVLGTFELEEQHRLDSFGELTERDALLFAQSRMKARELYPGLSWCTGNLSVQRALLIESGGFDESFRYAGGEDSELGYRLEKQFGTRLLYEPAARCGHDHALNIDEYARRQHVLGWAVLRMSEKHGDPALVHGRAEPLGEQFWSVIEDDVRSTAERFDSLIDEIRSICDRERESGSGARSVEQLRPLVECVAAVSFRRGLLDARAGREPFARCDTQSERPPAESAELEATPSLAGTPAEPTAETVPESAEATCLSELARHLHTGSIVELVEQAPYAANALLEGCGDREVLLLGRSQDVTARTRFLVDLCGSSNLERLRLIEAPALEGAKLIDEAIGLLVLPAGSSSRATSRLLEAWSQSLRDGALIVLRQLPGSSLRIPDRIPVGPGGHTHACQQVGELHVHRFHRVSSRAAI